MTTTALLSDTTVKRSLFRNDTLQEEFKKNGYVVIDFLSPEETTALHQAFNDLPQAMGQPAFASTIMSGDAGYRRAVSEIVKKGFVRAVNDILEDALVFLGNFNIKYPNRSGMVQMHQDPSFIDERKYSSLVIWVPLTDTTSENGALQVIPGSHLVTDRPRCGGRGFIYDGFEESLLERFGKQLLMKAGQAYIASPMLFHSSPPNTDMQPRIAAAGLAGPKESRLIYHQYKEADGNAFAELFETDHEYYVAAPLFSKPDTTRYNLLGTIPIDEDIPSPDDLFKMLSNPYPTR